MKLHHKLLIALLLGVSAILPATTANAQRISIQVGDRPYYNRGAFYVNNGYRYTWVPGHWSRNRRNWVHGHYARGDRDRNWLERRHRAHRAVLFGR